MLSNQISILVAGGSGYLGQFLVHSLVKDYKVHYTYSTHALASAPEGVVAQKVDLATGEGLNEVFKQTIFHAVVNCAAMSQPGACEGAPETARSVNVPTHLADCVLEQQRRCGVAAVLVHVSTDQVYDGSKAYWKEDDPCAPVNVYGRTKLEAEQLLLSRFPAPYPLVILRSSIIYGPPPPDPVQRVLFLQFVAAAVRGGKPTTFFTDEWRNPVYVRDLERLVARAIRELAPLGTSSSSAAVAATVDADSGGEAAAEDASAAATAGQQHVRSAWRHRVFNAGGPERLSREDMARQVADCLGCSHDAIVAAPSSSVARAVASPPDISMDVGRLATDLGFHTTPFREALGEIFSTPQ